MRASRIRTISCRTFIAIVAVIGSACGGTSAPPSPAAATQSPAAPTAAPAPTVRAITVSGTSPAIGASAQFGATAAFSDATSRDVTRDAAWQSSRDTVATVSPSGVVTALAAGNADIRADYQGVSGSQQITIAPPPPPPPPPIAPQCDSRLWTHLYDPVRLKVISPCQTMTGTVASQHHSDDGDVDMRIVPDAPYAHLLSGANNGSLQVEAICQAPINPNTPAASVSCKGFNGSVLIPPIGAHVQVTGSYVLDTNHGWMEIHPTTAISMVR